MLFGMAWICLLKNVQIKITLWNQNMAGSIIWQFCEFSIFKDLQV